MVADYQQLPLKQKYIYKYIMLSAHTPQICLKKAMQDKDALYALGERKKDNLCFQSKRDDVSKLPDFRDPACCITLRRLCSQGSSRFVSTQIWNLMWPVSFSPLRTHYAHRLFQDQWFTSVSTSVLHHHRVTKRLSFIDHLAEVVVSSWRHTHTA